jgi:hypothetical protein
MQFFRTFPAINVTNTDGSKTVATNLMVRTQLVSSLSKVPLLYYLYETQDGDSADIIASKYYDTSYRYWIFMYGNQFMDPLYDVSLSQLNFQAYMQDKYGQAAAANNQSLIAYTNGTVFQYIETIQTVDSQTLVTTSTDYIIDANTYNNFIPSTQVTVFDDGSYVTTTTSVRPQSIYEYEEQQNNNKKSVNILNNSYASQVEKQLKTLLKA